MRLIYLLAALLAGIAGPSAAKTSAPATGRTAILCAFEPEWTALVGLVKHPQTRTVQGVRVVSGTLEGHSVLLMLSGVSMVNAALNTQFVIDHFPVRRIVFSGKAGDLLAFSAVRRCIDDFRFRTQIHHTIRLNHCIECK